MSNNIKKLDAFPLFFKVKGKSVVVVGNGDEALAKARLLLQSSAALSVVADCPEHELVQFLHANDDVVHIEQPYNRALLADASLVFAATGDDAIDAQIVEDAHHFHIPANAVDQPSHCDFFTPALVNRAPVAIAIGTQGAGPVLAQMIRARIDQMLSPSLGSLAELAASYRLAAEKLLQRGAPRRSFWRSFFSGDVAQHVDHGDLSSARRAATKLLRQNGGVQGHIALVGAGPGAIDLLTLRAQRLLMQADVIVHDALVPDDIIAMGRRDAQRIDVGKRKGCHSKTQDQINDILVELGNQGKRVVRLKSGDPLIFGRAGEEIQVLRDNDISYEIVPGVTAAFSAAADFELPLTLRGVASSLVLTTGHDLKGGTLPDWAKLALSGATLGVYMGRSVAGDIAERLIDAGLPAETTVCVVENASLDNRRLLHGVLSDLPKLEDVSDLTGPVMTIIGDAVAGADFSQSQPIRAVAHTKTQHVALRG